MQIGHPDTTDRPTRQKDDSTLRDGAEEGAAERPHNTRGVTTADATRFPARASSRPSSIFETMSDDDSGVPRHGIARKLSLMSDEEVAELFDDEPTDRHDRGREVKR